MQFKNPGPATLQQILAGNKNRVLYISHCSIPKWFLFKIQCGIEYRVLTLCKQRKISRKHRLLNIYCSVKLTVGEVGGNFIRLAGERKQESRDLRPVMRRWDPVFWPRRDSGKGFNSCSSHNSNNNRRNFMLSAPPHHPHPHHNNRAEPVFLNVHGAQESILRHQFRQPM